MLCSDDSANRLVQPLKKKTINGISVNIWGIEFWNNYIVVISRPTKMINNAYGVDCIHQNMHFHYEFFSKLHTTVMFFKIVHLLPPYLTKNFCQTIYNSVSLLFQNLSRLLKTAWNVMFAFLCKSEFVVISKMLVSLKFELQILSSWAKIVMTAYSRLIIPPSCRQLAFCRSFCVRADCWVVSIMVCWGASCYHVVIQCYAALFPLTEWGVQERNEGARGAQLPGCQITGALKDCWGRQKSHQCQKCTFFNTVAYI